MRNPHPRNLDGKNIVAKIAKGGNFCFRSK